MRYFSPLTLMVDSYSIKQIVEAFEAWERQIEYSWFCNDPRP